MVHRSNSTQCFSTESVNRPSTINIDEEEEEDDSKSSSVPSSIESSTTSGSSSSSSLSSSLQQSTTTSSSSSSTAKTTSLSTETDEDINLPLLLDGLELIKIRNIHNVVDDKKEKEKEKQRLINSATNTTNRNIIINNNNNNKKCVKLNDDDTNLLLKKNNITTTVTKNDLNFSVQELSDKDTNNIIVPSLNFIKQKRQKTKKTTNNKRNNIMKNINYLEKLNHDNINIINHDDNVNNSEQLNSHDLNNKQINNIINDEKTNKENEDEEEDDNVDVNREEGDDDDDDSDGDKVNENIIQKLNCSLPLERVSTILESLNLIKKLDKNYDNTIATSTSTIDAATPSSSSSSSPATTEPITQLNKSMCLYCDRTFSSQTLRIKHSERVHQATKGRRSSARNSITTTSSPPPQSSTSLSSSSSTTTTPPTICSSTSNKTLNKNLAYPGCTFCNIEKKISLLISDNLYDLFIHLIDQHSDKYYGCKLCMIRFTNFDLLNIHMQDIHKTEIKIKNGAGTTLTSSPPKIQISQSSQNQSITSKRLSQKNSLLKSKRLHDNKLPSTDNNVQKISVPLTVEVDFEKNILANIITSNITNDDVESTTTDQNQSYKNNNDDCDNINITNQQLRRSTIMSRQKKHQLLKSEELILSRLGVTQNRSPRTRKSANLNNTLTTVSSSSSSSSSSSTSTTTTISTTSLSTRNSNRRSGNALNVGNNGLIIGNNNNNNTTTTDIRSTTEFQTTQISKILRNNNNKNGRTSIITVQQQQQQQHQQPTTSTTILDNTITGTITTISSTSTSSLLSSNSSSLNTSGGGTITKNEQISFDDDFYENVSLNVRKNLCYYIDGKLDNKNEIININYNNEQLIMTNEPQLRSTVVKSPTITQSLNDINEIHEATALQTLTAFPTLLTADQYGTAEQSAANKIKRTFTKNSWKWKWDFIKKYKYVNEGGKIVKKIKQQTSGFRDLSKLDMWTQLTMRTKYENLKRQEINIELPLIPSAVQLMPSSSTTTTTINKKNKTTLKQQQQQQQQQSSKSKINESVREEKRKLIDQLNIILDSRLLPQINLEQNDQRIVKIEPTDDDNVDDSQTEEIKHKIDSLPLEEQIQTVTTTAMATAQLSLSSSKLLDEHNSNEYDENQFASILQLQRINNKYNNSNLLNNKVILSGEWARPRCYVCFGCGEKFETLKYLEEHKQVNHPYVYSTHYEIVGRELIERELYRHFYIPSIALKRHTEYNRKLSTIQDLIIKDFNQNSNNNNNSQQQQQLQRCNSNIKDKIYSSVDDSMDSIVSGSCSTTTTATTTKSETCDTDTNSKISSKLSSSINSSIYNSGSSGSGSNNNNNDNNNSPIIDVVAASTTTTSIDIFKCTKCKRDCSGTLDLYRHMLDCSSDYAWLLAKKRLKYRYFGNRSRRRRGGRTNLGCGRPPKQQQLKQQKLNRKLDNKNKLLSTMSSSSSSSTSNSNMQRIKEPQQPRPRPSDAESIQRMLANLPPKRACRQINPNVLIQKKQRTARKIVVVPANLLKKQNQKKMLNNQQQQMKRRTRTSMSAITNNKQLCTMILPKQQQQQQQHTKRLIHTNKKKMNEIKLTIDNNEKVNSTMKRDITLNKKVIETRKKILPSQTSSPSPSSSSSSSTSSSTTMTSNKTIQSTKSDNNENKIKFNDKMNKNLLKVVKQKTQNVVRKITKKFNNKKPMQKNTNLNNTKKIRFLRSSSSLNDPISVLNNNDKLSQPKMNNNNNNNNNNNININNKQTNKSKNRLIRSFSFRKSNRKKNLLNETNVNKINDEPVEQVNDKLTQTTISAPQIEKLNVETLTTPTLTTELTATITSKSTTTEPSNKTITLSPPSDLLQQTDTIKSDPLNVIINNNEKKQEKETDNEKISNEENLGKKRKGKRFKNLLKKFKTKKKISEPSIVVSNLITEPSSASGNIPDVIKETATLSIETTETSKNSIVNLVVPTIIEVQPILSSLPPSTEIIDDQTKDTPQILLINVSQSLPEIIETAIPLSVTTTTTTIQPSTQIEEEEQPQKQQDTQNLQVPINDTQNLQIKTPPGKRRARKLNDCIAMLTGKLNEKLGIPTFSTKNNVAETKIVAAETQSEQQHAPETKTIVAEEKDIVETKNDVVETKSLVEPKNNLELTNVSKNNTTKPIIVVETNDQIVEPTKVIKNIVEITKITVEPPTNVDKIVRESKITVEQINIDKIVRETKNIVKPKNYVDVRNIAKHIDATITEVKKIVVHPPKTAYQTKINVEEKNFVQLSRAPVPKNIVEQINLIQSKNTSIVETNNLVQLKNILASKSFADITKMAEKNNLVIKNSYVEKSSSSCEKKILLPETRNFNVVQQQQPPPPPSQINIVDIEINDSPLDLSVTGTNSNKFKLAQLNSSIFPKVPDISISSCREILNINRPIINIPKVVQHITSPANYENRHIMNKTMQQQQQQQPPSPIINIPKVQGFSMSHENHKINNVHQTAIRNIPNAQEYSSVNNNNNMDNRKIIDNKNQSNIDISRVPPPLPPPTKASRKLIDVTIQPKIIPVTNNANVCVDLTNSCDTTDEFENNIMRFGEKNKSFIVEKIPFVHKSFSNILKHHKLIETIIKPQIEQPPKRTNVSELIKSLGVIEKPQQTSTKNTKTLSPIVDILKTQIIEKTKPQEIEMINSQVNVTIQPQIQETTKTHQMIENLTKEQPKEHVIPIIISKEMEIENVKPNTVEIVNVKSNEIENLNDKSKVEVEVVKPQVVKKSPAKRNKKQSKAKVTKEKKIPEELLQPSSLNSIINTKSYIEIENEMITTDNDVIKHKNIDIVDIVKPQITTEKIIDNVIKCQDIIETSTPVVVVIETIKSQQPNESIKSQTSDASAEIIKQQQQSTEINKPQFIKITKPNSIEIIKPKMTENIIEIVNLADEENNENIDKSKVKLSDFRDIPVIEVPHGFFPKSTAENKMTDEEKTQENEHNKSISIEVTLIKPIADVKITYESSEDEIPLSNIISKKITTKKKSSKSKNSKKSTSLNDNENIVLNEKQTEINQETTTPPIGENIISTVLSDVDNKITPRPRKKRKNELAAIIADQLLESFKEVDKTRIDELKLLHNLNAHDNITQTNLTQTNLNEIITTRTTSKLKKNANKIKQIIDKTIVVGNAEEILDNDNNKINEIIQKENSTEKLNIITTKRSKLNLSKSSTDNKDEAEDEILTSTKTTTVQDQEILVVSINNTAKLLDESDDINIVDNSGSGIVSGKRKTRKTFDSVDSKLPRRRSARSATTVSDRRESLTLNDDDLTKIKTIESVSLEMNELKIKQCELEKELKIKENELEIEVEETAKSNALKLRPKRQITVRKLNDGKDKNLDLNKIDFTFDAIKISDDTNKLIEGEINKTLDVNLESQISNDEKIIDDAESAIITPKVKRLRRQVTQQLYAPPADEESLKNLDNNVEVIAPIQTRKIGTSRRNKNKVQEINDDNIPVNLNNAFIEDVNVTKTTPTLNKVSKDISSIVVATKNSIIMVDNNEINMKESSNTEELCNVPSEIINDDNKGHNSESDDDLCLAEIAKSLNNKILQSDEFSNESETCTPNQLQLSIDDKPFSLITICNQEENKQQQQTAVEEEGVIDDEEEQITRNLIPVSEIMEDNTNTDLIDMDLEDDMSVYTSLSLETSITTSHIDSVAGSKPKKRRYRKSILLKSRRTKQQKGGANINDIELEFFCDICKKMFRKQDSLVKHKMTLTHIAKLSEQEYLNLNNQQNQQKTENLNEELIQSKLINDHDDCNDNEIVNNAITVECTVKSGKKLFVMEKTDGNNTNNELLSIKNNEIIDDKLLYVESKSKEIMSTSLSPSLLCLSTKEQQPKELKQHYQSPPLPPIEQQPPLPPIEQQPPLPPTIEINQPSPQQLTIEQQQPHVIVNQQSFQPSLQSPKNQLQQKQNQPVHQQTIKLTSTILPPILSPSNSGIELISSPEHSDNNYDRYNTSIITTTRTTPTTPDNNSRLALSHEQRLFYECCNMLKGSDRTAQTTSSTTASTTTTNIIDTIDTSNVKYYGATIPDNKMLQVKQHNTDKMNNSNNIVYSVKSPISQSRTSPRLAYPKVDVNQFSDISSDSNQPSYSSHPTQSSYTKIIDNNLNNNNRLPSGFLITNEKYLNGGTTQLQQQFKVTAGPPKESPKLIHKNTEQTKNNNNQISSTSYPDNSMIISSYSDIFSDMGDSFPSSQDAASESDNYVKTVRDRTEFRNNIEINPLKYRSKLNNDNDKIRTPLSSPCFSIERDGKSSYPIRETFDSSIHSNSSQSSSVTSKILTKGALKGYDNFKVSIPTNGIDLQQALVRSNSHVSSKLAALADIALGDQPISADLIREQQPQIPSKSVDCKQQQQQQQITTPPPCKDIIKLSNKSLKSTSIVRKKLTTSGPNFGNKLGFKAKKTPKKNTKTKIGEKPIIKRKTTTNIISSNNEPPLDVYEFDETHETADAQPMLRLSKTPGFRPKIITKEMVDKVCNFVVNNKLLSDNDNNDRLQTQQQQQQQTNELDEKMSVRNDEVSSTSFSDRDDFNYGVESSLSDSESNDDDDDDDDDSDDDDHSQKTSRTLQKKEQKQKSKKLSDSNNLQKKCLIMGRIFKNAKKSQPTKELQLQIVETDKTIEKIPKLPKQELDKLFDRLKECENKNTNDEYDNDDDDDDDEDDDDDHDDEHEYEHDDDLIIDSTAIVDNEETLIKCDNKERGVRNKKDNIIKDDFEVDRYDNDAVEEEDKEEVDNDEEEEEEEEETPKKQLIKKSKKSREIQMLEAEWGMSLQQIKEIIGVGQRKSQRKCAVGKQKTLAETWSSDEYEDFHTTKDIIALIQETEMKALQRRSSTVTTQKQHHPITPAIKKVVAPIPPPTTPQNIPTTKDGSSGNVEDIVKSDIIITKENISSILKNEIKNNVATPITTTLPLAHKEVEIAEKLNDIDTTKTVIEDDETESPRSKRIKLKENRLNALSTTTTTTTKPKTITFRYDSESDFEAEWNKSGKRSKIKKRRKTTSFKEIGNKQQQQQQQQIKEPKRVIISDSESRQYQNNKMIVVQKEQKSQQKEKQQQQQEDSKLPLGRRKRIASEMLYYWSSSSDDDFGRIDRKRKQYNKLNDNDDDDENEDDDDDDDDDDDYDDGLQQDSGEHLQQHGWIVGDSHKKLVTLLAHAKLKN